MLKILLFILFIALGIVFISGRGGPLMAGLKAKPKEEKEKVDQTELCRCIGIVNLTIAVSVLLSILSNLLKSKVLSIFSFILFVFIVLLTIITIIAKNRFKTN